MAKLLLTVLVFLFSGYILAQDAPEAKHSYVGAKACGMCHKTEKQGQQLKIWEGSPHANAFEALKSEKAAAIAKEKGLESPAYEAKECLKCHITEFGVDASLLDAKYEPNMGVQCESCHGAGSDYKKMSIMKDRDAAIKNGMNDINLEDGSAEKLCVTCHNEESPTFDGFKFDEMWGKIAHTIPE
jgi:hypothetical protein